MSSRVISSLMAESFLLSKTVKYISGYSPITVFLVAAIAIITVLYNRRRARLVRLIEKIPGPKAMPLLGNAVEMSVDHDGKYRAVIDYFEKN